MEKFPAPQERGPEAEMALAKHQEWFSTQLEKIKENPWLVKLASSGAMAGLGAWVGGLEGAVLGAAAGTASVELVRNLIDIGKEAEADQEKP